MTRNYSHRFSWNFRRLSEIIVIETAAINFEVDCNEKAIVY